MIFAPIPAFKLTHDCRKHRCVNAHVHFTWPIIALPVCVLVRQRVTMVVHAITICARNRFVQQPQCDDYIPIAFGVHHTHTSCVRRCNRPHRPVLGTQFTLHTCECVPLFPHNIHASASTLLHAADTIFAVSLPGHRRVASVRSHTQTHAHNCIILRCAV